MKNETSITLFADLSQEAQDSARRVARMNDGILDGLSLGKFNIRQLGGKFYAMHTGRGGSGTCGFDTEWGAIEAGNRLVKRMEWNGEDER